MAGQYFYDPRPFYMQPGDYKLISLDDVSEVAVMAVVVVQ